MSKKFKDRSNSFKNISEYIFSDYIDDIEESESSTLINKIPLLIDNSVACKLCGTESLYSQSLSVYRIACKFITKYNEMVKDFRRELKEWEYGGEENTYAYSDKRLVELVKYSLDEGTYMAQLDSNNYMVLTISFNEGDSYIINYEIYFIGKKWRKWKNKFNKTVKNYKEISKSQKSEYIRYSDNRPITDSIFKPFSKLVFKDKDKIIKYIDNFVESIPKYYEYGMIPKLSIMLYGDPGTGKSTFAKAVANYLGIESVTLITPDYFKEDSKNTMRGSYVETVYVLDDIDCVCQSRELNSDTENAKALSNLLAFLDNPPTFDYKAKDNVRYPISIVVASTNYIDKLDNAVKRYGRFDLKVEMKNFTKAEAKEMCDIYGLDVKEILPDCDKKGFTISPSQLQALCLENLDKAMKKVDK